MGISYDSDLRVMSLVMEPFESTLNYYLHQMVSLLIYNLYMRFYFQFLISFSAPTGPIFYSGTNNFNRQTNSICSSVSSRVRFHSFQHQFSCDSCATITVHSKTVIIRVDHRNSSTRIYGKDISFSENERWRGKFDKRDSRRPQHS